MNYFGLVFAILGLFVSGVILSSRFSKKNKICPRRGGCDIVNNSKYSKTFFIRNDILGFLYYLFFIITIVLVGDNKYMLEVLKSLSIFGFIFSLYLVFVQAFILKKWCKWCLLSALAAVSLFTSFF